MRDYRFRGKRIDNGEWVYGSLIRKYEKPHKAYIPFGYWIYVNEDVCHKVDPETVGQYTGLPDENGTDIYEKDRFQHENDIGTVVFRNGMFCVEWDAPYTWRKDTLLWKLHSDGRVIQDNLDLLEDEKIWTVVNTVYFNDGTNEIFGYEVKDENNTVRKKISSKTANALTLKGQIRVSPRQELSFCSVDRGFVEDQLDNPYLLEGEKI